MKKSDFMRKMAKQNGYFIYTVSQFMEIFIDTLAEVLNTGEEVKIHGLGTFKAVKTKERMMKNPQTREECLVKSRTKITFHPSKMLLDKCPMPVEENKQVNEVMELCKERLENIAKDREKARELKKWLKGKENADGAELFKELFRIEVNQSE